MNELMDEAKRKKLKRIMFKEGFAKAYDSVEWKFVDEMVAGMNFSSKWRKWVMECI